LYEALTRILMRFTTSDLAPKFYPVLSSLRVVDEVLPKTRPAGPGIFPGYEGDFFHCKTLKSLGFSGPCAIHVPGPEWNAQRPKRLLDGACSAPRIESPGSAYLSCMAMPLPPALSVVQNVQPGVLLRR
jgi:hypothetical protein